MFGLFKKKKEQKPKSYKFEAQEMACIGDKYVYEVEAESREQAMRFLADYFFGSKHRGGITSEHFTVTTSGPPRDHYYGMPDWFGRNLGTEWNEKDKEKLNNYLQENNIVRK